MEKMEGSYWQGTSPSGVKIGGFLNESGNISTAYPLYNQ
jgi:filamentous hemagglutinin